MASDRSALTRSQRLFSSTEGLIPERRSRRISMGRWARDPGVSIAGATDAFLEASRYAGTLTGAKGVEPQSRVTSDRLVRGPSQAQCDGATSAPPSDARLRGRPAW